MSTSSNSETIQQLTRFAERFRADPDYMASALVAYQSQEKLADSELAQRLAIEIDQLPRLALCKRPHSPSDKFGEEVRQIASFTGADQAVLAQIVRQVEAVSQLQELQRSTKTPRGGPAPAATSPLMAAARDRQEQEDKETDDTPDGHDDEG